MPLYIHVEGDFNIRLNIRYTALKQFTFRGLNATYVSDMSLKVSQSKGAHNKPEFERTETSAEGNLPVLNNRKKVVSLYMKMIHYCY